MNCTPLCVNQDEKFIQVKLTPLRSIFKYGYIVNLIFLYKQIGDLLSIHSEAGLIFTIIDLIFTICHSISSLPPYLTSPQPPKLYFLLLLASSLTNDSGGYRNQIFTHIGMADSKPTNVHEVIKYLGWDIWYTQNIKIMQFDKYKTNVLEMPVNWLQPKTEDIFLKDKSQVIKIWPIKLKGLCWLRIYLKC